MAHPRPILLAGLLCTTAFMTLNQAQAFDMRAQSSILLKDEAPIITAYVGNNEQHSSDSAFIEPEKALTMQEHKDEAIKAIKNKTFQIAKKHIQALEGSEFSEDASYFTAVVQAQLGLFNDALKTVNQNAYSAKGRQDDFFNLKNALVLALTHKYIETNAVSDAKSMLRQFVGNSASNDQREQFNALYTKVNNPADEYTLENARILKVGLILPLTGAQESVGNSMLRAAQLSLFDHSPTKIMLFPHDTQSTAEGTKEATRSALRDGVDIIVGPLSASQTQIVDNYASAADIPVLSFSSNASAAKGNVQLLGFLPDEQARVMAQHAADIGIKTVAIFAPDTTYGHLMHDAFEKEASKLGLTVKRSQFFDLSSNDHSKQLRVLSRYNEAKHMIDKMRAKLEKQYEQLGAAMNDEDLNRLKELQKAEPTAAVDFEALYIPAPAQAMPLIASELAYYDMDSSRVTLLGSAQWNSSSILANRGEYLRGGLFPAPNENKLAVFQREYKAVYSKTPHPVANLAYDAVHMISTLYKENPGDIRSIKRGIKRSGGFTLSSGPVRFLENGESTRAYNIMKIQSRGFEVVSQAPDIMPPALPQTLSSETTKKKDGFNLFNPWGW